MAAYVNKKSALRGTPGKFFVIRCLVLLVAAINISNAANSHKTWQLETDDDGIQVYIIKVDNTDIIKAKSVAKLKASLAEIKSILDDIEHRHEWVPFLKQSSVIEKQSEKSRVEYSLFSAPWPASDRDFVYSLQLTLNTANKQIYEMHSVKTPAMPENADRIRGEIFESKYILTAVAENITQVELIYHADPKGWLPNWIINIIQKALPYKILRNLRDRLEGG